MYRYMWIASGWVRHVYPRVSSGFAGAEWNGVLKNECHIDMLRQSVNAFSAFGMGVANTDGRCRRDPFMKIQ